MLKINSYCHLTFILLSIVCLFWVVFVVKIRKKVSCRTDCCYSKCDLNVKAKTDRLLCSIVILSFAVIVLHCTFPSLCWTDIRSNKSLRKYILVVGRALFV